MKGGEVLAIVSACFLCLGSLAAAQSLNIGPAELLYTDAQMPFGMDGSFATLRQDSNTMCFFHTYGTTTSKHCGPLDQPLQTRMWEKSVSELWDMKGYTGWPWMVNFYKIDSDRLLAFIHKEILGPDGYAGDVHYSIGLGYSTSGGESWSYLGDIVRPQEDTGNVGGVPFLEVGDYLYVYYNEYPSSGGKRPSVARARTADVLSAAGSGMVTGWKKYNNGAWDQDGLTGVGSNIIPEASTDTRYDTHADASYNTALGKYLLTIQTHGLGELLIYQSDDGVNWGSRMVVDESGNGFIQAYSTFAALSGATDDSRETGEEFYLIYPRKDWPDNYNYDELYRRKVTVSGMPGPYCGDSSCNNGETCSTCASDCGVCSTTKPGDLNQDGKVDIFDLTLVASNYGKSTGFDLRADANQDGKIDIFDLVAVAKEFGG